MWPTILAGAIVAAVFIAIVASAVRNRKTGKHSCSCGGGCSGCALSGSCHPQTTAVRKGGPGGSPS